MQNTRRKKSFAAFTTSECSSALYFFPCSILRQSELQFAEKYIRRSFCACLIFCGNIQKHLLLCTYKRHNLLPKRHCGLVLLPQQLHETLSVFQTLYGLLIQFAAETENTCISRYCARSSRIEPTDLRMTSDCAAPPTRLTDNPTLTAGR